MTKQVITPEAEFKTLTKLFFLFGFGIMSWIPRFPDFKAQLGLTNGQFGSIISLGNVGAFISLLTVGHIVHKLGSYKVLIASTCSLYLGFILIASISSSLIFIPVVILVGFSSSAFHISVNSQAFDSQTRNTKPIIVKLHGIWTMGAVSTGLVSGLLIGRISATMQLNIVYVLVFLLKIKYINKLRPVALLPKLEDDHYSVKQIFKSLRFDRLIAGGMICAILIEIAMGDWSNIFAREYLGIKGGLITLPYILFTLAMIVGRLNLHKLLPRYSMDFLVVRASLLSGLSFIAGIVAVGLVGPSNKTLVLVILSIAFTIAGLGSSFLGPSVMVAANARSQFPASVVIGQIGVINIALVFVMRWVIAWTAQATSLSVALLIPALMLLAVPYFSKIFKNV